MSRKISERRNLDVDKETAVFFHETMIPLEKVKKEISRHIHPNESFYTRQLIRIHECWMSLIVRQGIYHEVR